MTITEAKIKKAIVHQKLSLSQPGERNWYGYFIRITLLRWAVNPHNGYKIEVYQKEYGGHLLTVIN